MAEIRTVAVVSASKLGRHIARLTALAGYRTLLEDVIPSTLRSAENELRTSLQPRAEANTSFDQIEFADSLEKAVREADLAIEAVPDEMESKLEIFTLLDRICRPGTILASTTSSLSIADIGSVTLRKDKCLGMRFLDSSGEIRHVDFVRTSKTDDETVAAVAELARRIGCDVSVVSEPAYSDQTTPLLIPTNA